MILTTKYGIGDKVFGGVGSILMTVKPCRDCNDTHEWPLVTPAGESVIAQCPTCTYLQVQRYRTPHGYAQPLTIGQVRVEHDGAKTEIQYMCVETGIGSGSLWNESDLFDTEEAAKKTGEWKARKLVEESDARDEEVRKQNLRRVKRKRTA